MKNLSLLALQPLLRFQSSRKSRVFDTSMFLFSRPSWADQLDDIEPLPSKQELPQEEKSKAKRKREAKLQRKKARQKVGISVLWIGGPRAFLPTKTQAGRGRRLRGPSPSSLKCTKIRQSLLLDANWSTAKMSHFHFESQLTPTLTPRLDPWPFRPFPSAQMLSVLLERVDFIMGRNFSSVDTAWFFAGQRGKWKCDGQSSSQPER